MSIVIILVMVIINLTVLTRRIYKPWSILLMCNPFEASALCIYCCSICCIVLLAWFLAVFLACSFTHAQKAVLRTTAFWWSINNCGNSCSVVMPARQFWNSFLLCFSVSFFVNYHISYCTVILFIFLASLS